MKISSHPHTSTAIFHHITPLIALTLGLMPVANGQETAATPAALPAPSPATVPPASSPPEAVASAEPTEAPATTYFLLQRVTVPVEGGMRGVNPGTQLRLIDKSGPLWKFAAPNAILEVDPSIVTNDPAVAAQMAEKASKARDAALAARRAEMQAAQAREQQLAAEAAANASSLQMPNRATLGTETGLKRSTLNESK